MIRRWWSLVAAGVLIGLVVGWISAPGSTAPRTYQATQSMFLATTAGGTDINRLALTATLGAIPDRVATRLHIDRTLMPSVLSAQVHPNENELLITGRSTDRAQAEALATVTAQELISELGGPSKSPLKTLEPAVASPVRSDDVKGPTSRTGRALLLGGFGLLLGIGAVFVAERFDDRIRTKRAVEDALGVAVVAEVPRIPRSQRGGLVSGAQPSPFVEAYRGLRTMVAQWASAQDGSAGRVIAVTSAAGGEGKTTTVAQLAAALAEVGRSVVAVSADLRHPQLHGYFDKAREPGLVELLRGTPDVRRLADLNLATTVRGVRFVASGPPVRNPGPLVDQLAEHLEEARELGDFVLVDAPPLLTASEAADLAHLADGVLLVVRAGRTSIGAAARSAELLQRLNIPLIGAVLVGGDRGRRYPL